jgi:hypothetical protein
MVMDGWKTAALSLLASTTLTPPVPAAVVNIASHGTLTEPVTDEWPQKKELSCGAAALAPELQAERSRLTMSG